MTFALIQLSNINIGHLSDPILMRCEAIADACIGPGKMVQHCIIIVAGDIVHNGLVEHYHLAEQFLTDLVSRLNEGLPSLIDPCEVILLPGDQDHEPGATVTARSLLLQQLRQDPSKASAPGVVEVLTSPQRVFRRFVQTLRDKEISPIPSSETLHYSVYSSRAAGSARIVCLNSSWACEPNDRKAGLIPPTVPSFTSTSEATRVTVLHHPIRCFRHDYREDFRKKLRESSDWVLTGFSDIPASRAVDEVGRLVDEEFEPRQLNDHAQPELGGFNMMIVDPDRNRQQLISFTWDGEAYRSLFPGASWEPPPLHKARLSTRLVFSDSHLKYLEDPGLNLFNQEPHGLSEFFVFPDLTERDFGERDFDFQVADIVKSENVLRMIERHPNVLITGEEFSGKTALARMLCLSLYRGGRYPLLLTPTDRVPSDRRLRKVLDREIEKQYSLVVADSFWGVEKEQRVLIIDDFDLAARNQAGRARLLLALDEFFEKIVVIGNDLAMVMAFLESQPPVFYRYSKYKINPFGYINRNTLVERWLCLSPDSEPEKLALRISQVTRTLDGVLGTGFVPAYPAYVLAVLQASEASMPIDTNISTHGYYFELLIRVELLRGSSNKDYDIVTGYLSYVAYRAFQLRRSRMTLDEYDSIHRAYEAAYDLRLDKDALLERLCEHRMLHRPDELIIQFKYPYIFYYFTALYLKDHLGDMEVRAHIGRLSKEMHKKGPGNILLFMAHLTKDEYVINTLTARAAEFFPRMSKVKNFSEVSVPGEMIELIEKVAYEERSIDESRRELAARKDELAEHVANQAEVEFDEDTEVRFHELKAALRTVQVLGQVLKNYPGHLDGNTKLMLAQNTFALGSRTWKYLFNQLMSTEDEFVRHIIATLQDNDPGAAANVIQKRAQESVRFFVLVCGLGMIHRMADSIGAPELDATYEKLVKHEGGTVSRLVRTVIHLEHQPTTPQKEIFKTYELVKDQPLGAWILRIFVVRHFELYEADIRVKQRVCGKIGIQYKPGVGGRKSIRKLSNKKS